MIRTTATIAARTQAVTRTALSHSDRFIHSHVHNSMASPSSLPSSYSALYLSTFVPNAEALPAVKLSSRDSTDLTKSLRPEEVIVKVAYASVNPSDVKNSLGFMSSTVLPRILGRDFCGTVVQAGSSSTNLIGQEVFGTGGDLGFENDGSHAEFMRLPAAAVAIKPASLSSQQASSVGVNYCTALHGLERGELTAKDIVLVTGANGGVGSAVVQLAKQTGAKVIAVLRSKPKEGAGASEVASNGKQTPGVADANIYLSDLPAGFADLPEAVRRLPLIQDAFGGQPDNAHHRRGPSLIYDVLGGDIVQHLLGSLATRGRMVCIAMPLPHSPVPIDGLELYRQELKLIGVNSLLLSAVDCAVLLKKLSVGFNSGALQTRDTSTSTFVSLEQIGQAYADVIGGKAKGKIIVEFAKKA